MEFQQFLLEKFAHLLGPLLLAGRFPHLLDLLLDGVSAQFILDGLDLLMEEVFALLLVHFGADLALDLVLHLQHLQLLGKVRQQHVGTLPQVGHFEHPLLLRHFGVHVATDEVHQEARAVDVLDGETGLGGNVRAGLDDVGCEILQ